MATITEVAKNRKYRIRSFQGRDSDGRPVQKFETFYGTKSTAKDRGIQLDAEAITSGTRTRVVRGSETVRDLFSEWLKYGEHDKGWSPTTARLNRLRADATILPAVSEIRLSKLSEADLEALYSRLRRQGKAESYVRLVHANISAALRFGERKRWITMDRNPARHVEAPGTRTNTRHAPTVEEITLLIKAAEKEPTATRYPWLATLIFVASTTGARRGELCALRWRGLDWNAGTLRIAGSLYDNKGGGVGEKDTKTHQTHTISLDPATIAVLRSHHTRISALVGSQLREETFIFSPDGFGPLQPSHVSHVFAWNRDRAGVSNEVVLHGGRHFAATQAIAAGHDIVTVSKRLGHSSPTITGRFYADASSERDKAVAKTLGAQLTPRTPE